VIYCRLLKRSGVGLALFISVGVAAFAQGSLGTTMGQQPLATASEGGASGPSDGKRSITSTSTVSDASKDQSLTYHGITIYGIIDSGLSNQTNGAPYNSDAPQTGVENSIGPNGRESITHLSDNGMSQSVIGIRGNVKLFEGLSFIFNLAPGIEPLSLRFTNSLQSLVTNNGVSLQDQTTDYDTNRAGGIDNGDAYLGLKLKGYGALTFGRQTSLIVDSAVKYDPNPGSYNFSLIGYIGNYVGGGDSEDDRLNSSIKYANQIGPFRLGALGQFKGHNAVFSRYGVYGSTSQLDLGADYRHLSADFTYSRRYDGISAASLSAAQMLTAPATSLAATISDNTAYNVMGKDTVGRHATVYGGYGHIRYANPGTPLTPGITTIGGYELSVLNQTVYTNNKILQVYWTGLKYSLTPKLDLTGSYYGWRQNSYSGNGCSNNSSSKCSGNRNNASFDAVYKLTKHLDAYGGLMWSDVTNGLSAGYLATNSVSTIFGGRFTF